MALTKIINDENKSYRPVLTDKLVLDAVPTVNSFNSVTSDAVARAIAGASGEVPQVTESDNGKVLTAVYDAGGAAVEWAESAGGLPDTTGASQGDVLTIGSSGAEWAAVPTELPASLGTAGQVLTVNAGATGVEWASAQSGSSYTAGAGIEISQQNAISVSTDNATLDFDAVDTTLTSNALPTAQFTPTVSLANTNTCTIKLVPDSTITIVAPAEANGKELVCRLRSVKNSTTIYAYLQVGIGACFYNNSSVYQLSAGTNTISTTLTLKNALDATTFNQQFYSPYPVQYTWDDILLEDFYIDFGYAVDLEFGDVMFGTLTISGGHVEIVTDAGAHSSLKVKNPLPASTSGDQDKVLTVNSSGTPVWAASSSVTIGTIAIDPYNPLNLPAYTMRFQYSDDTFDPSYQYSGAGTWTQVTSSPNVWDFHYEDANWGEVNGVGVLGYYWCCANMDATTTILGAETSGVTNMSYLFCSPAETVVFANAFDTANVTDMHYMFANGYNATWVNIPEFDTSSCTNMSHMFESASFTVAPAIDTSNVEDASYMFGSCSNLTAVPLLATNNMTDVSNMFNSCVHVETGAYNLYSQMSSQTTPPATHADCFTSCGSSTAGGQAELDQIPASWGGNAV